MLSSSEPLLGNLLPVLAAVGVSLGLGLYVAFVYRLATPGAAFSITIQHTLLYLALIVSLVMVIISNQVARAFTLVGALAVVRFRTPVKDTRDAAFIFLGLAAGMGAGVGMYAETAAGVALIGLCMIAVRFLRLGKRPHGETLVKFTIPSGGGGEPAYPRDAFERHFQSVRLIGTRSACDGERVELTYLVKPRQDADLVAFSRALSAYPLVEKATVIVCDDEGLTENVF
ncbi:MAG TPA: hypothetical protein PKG50_02040 [Candidatus Bipolaricaulis anaerobius]|nr:hypothetical protein [Candidatus Bipolaricaulis anaerobius]HNS23717.1 hypothetical protein [Candidatus Bipolaricaulis anaerobius]